LTDASRRDPVHPEASRALIVQVWYPADGAAKGPRAPYLSEEMAAALIAHRYYQTPPAEISAWRRLSTGALLDAPPRRSARFPLLTFSHGLGVARASYTSLLTELASRGYVVAAIDHPYGGLTVLNDGRVLTTDDDPRSTDEDRAREWAADIRFVIDHLLLSPTFAGTIDGKRIGAFGHSMGGAAAFEAARLDRRIGAACDMDGLPMHDALENGVPKPALFLRSQPVYSDRDLETLGRTRARWEEMGATYRAMVKSMFDKQPLVPGFEVQLAGTGHMSFSDAPFLMPSTLNRFGGRLLTAERTWTLVTSVLFAFFDEELRARHSPLLHGKSKTPVSLRRFGPNR
jgi:dienelactone hydrolase